MNTKIITVLIVIISLLSGFIGSYIFPITQENKNISMSDIENKITNIVENTSPGVVNIVINKDLTIYRNDPFNFFFQPVGNISRKVGGGTGFFITKDGIILTNKHVIQDKKADYTVVLNNGNEYTATLLGVVPNNDIAIIKIDLKEDIVPLRFIENYEGDEIKVGQFAIATGYALAEFQNSVSLGIISGKNRTIEAGGDKLSGLLQTDAAINPGNSGGPLINLEGKVMGINTAISGNAQGVGFAIPLSQKYINKLLKSIQ